MDQVILGDSGMRARTRHDSQKFPAAILGSGPKLGTGDHPETAYLKTRKALEMLQAEVLMLKHENEGSRYEPEELESASRIRKAEVSEFMQAGPSR